MEEYLQRTVDGAEQIDRSQQVTRNRLVKFELHGRWRGIAHLQARFVVDLLTHIHLKRLTARMNSTAVHAARTAVAGPCLPSSAPSLKTARSAPSMGASGNQSASRCSHSGAVSSV